MSAAVLPPSPVLAQPLPKQVPPEPLAADEMAPALSPYKLSVAQYHKMVTAGILTRSDRVELLEGELITTSPVSPFHAGVYAVEGLNEYWIVNLVDQRIEVYHGVAVNAEGAASYQSAAAYRPGEPVPVQLEGKKIGTIDPAELFIESSDA